MLIRPLRLTSRLVLFSLVLLSCALLAACVSATELLTRRKLDRTPFACFCFGLASRCLGFQVNLRGAKPKGTVLLVSNHISWSDIPILGSVVPLRFLSKIEVRSWPVIGWLAQQAGTLFIRRGGGQARTTREQIANTLRNGQSVLVFPEGTTTLGITVLPFHSRLLAAAADAKVPIQPISIGYRRNDRPDHLAPFIGDDPFERHLIRVLREPAVCVDIILHEPVAMTAEDDLQAVAQRLRESVQKGLGDIHQGPGENGKAPGFPASHPPLGNT
ncbi:lysophospholipid acyltransferase family protein [Marinobacter fonticola]|uniref:lysophospholipid acyltransferase family protein n=1 Tax=Marinobacter fonticola TaxID=2603215 RepID=UPI0011E6918E|nr:lysophospholipid acyltransferase family protein [Marinobacter fonticola]